MRICIVGGIFDKRPEYRRFHGVTPETLLADGLTSRGHEIDRAGHLSTLDVCQYDLIHVHHVGRAALRMSLRSGSTPFVFTAHDLSVMNGYQTRTTWRIGYRWACQSADAVVALSTVERDFLRRQMRPTGTIDIIRNGIDHRVFTLLEPENAGGLTALCVAQLAPIKGIDVLLHAVAQMRARVPLRLRLIYQDDRNVAVYRALADELGIADDVTFVGACTPEALAREYAGASFVVLPSRSESRPSVLTEALLCGTPSVATAVGAVPEVVGPFGELCHPGSVESLVSATERLLQRLPVLSRDGAAMRAYACATSDVETMVVAHEALYEKVLRNGTRRRSPADRVMRRIKWCLVQGMLSVRPHR